MSEKKLKNYLDKHSIAPPAVKSTRRPVILSDSKGTYLKSNITEYHHQNILWWCKGGAKIEDSYSWLKRNLAARLYEIGDIALYIWIGTCNLTTKSGNTIGLTSTDNTTVDHIAQYIDKTEEFLSDFKQVKVTFLELPVYSIKSYNSYYSTGDTDTKGNKQQDINNNQQDNNNNQQTKTYKQQDEYLAYQINLANEKIRSTNLALNTHSPNFSFFLQARKQHRVRRKNEV